MAAGEPKQVPSTDRQGRSGRRAFLLVLAAALLAGVAGVIAAGGTGWMSGAGQGDWLAGALTSKLSLLCIALLLGGALVVSLLIGVMYVLGGPGRAAKRSGQEGTAIIEFVLVMPIVLTLSLIMAQSSLLLGGNLCVHYAAYCAARTAIVQVPNNIDPLEPPNYVLNDPNSTKMYAIRLSAIWAVLPVSSSSKDLPEADAAVLSGALSSYFSRHGRPRPGWARPDYLGRKLSYAIDYTDVELDEPIGYTVIDGETYYGPGEDLRVTVRHMLYLSVPYANRIFAELLDPQHGQKLGFGPGAYGLEIQASSKLTNEGVQDFVDIEQFPGSL